MKEFELFFQLIVDSLNDSAGKAKKGRKERAKEYAGHWEELHKELEAQTITGLPYKFVKDHVDLAPEARMAYRLELMEIATNYCANMQMQSEILEVLEKNEIPAVVLKGSAAAIYYPDPEIRAMGDIDIIVKPDCFEKAYNVLCANGFDAEPLDTGKRHNELHKDGFELELHIAFATLKDKNYRANLDNMIYKGIDERITGQVSGFEFPMLPHDINGLTLLCHMDYHMEEGPGIRHLLDWMFFVEKHLDDQEWHGNFKKKAERIGLMTMAEVLTKCCQKYLGLTKTITWCNDADEALCDELMEFIMHFGNFGSKDKDSILRGNILYMMKTPADYIRFAQTFGLRTWKVLDKHPRLKPFAWIYQSFRFLSHGLKKRSGLDNSLRDYKMMERKNNLLKRIKSNH